MHKAIFLDRDDTIIHDVPYNGDPSLVELVPQAADALHKLKMQGFLLFIISNQSGVGRGYITPKQVDHVNQEMVKQLGADYFTAIYSCYDAPDNQQNGCRKPSPQMLLKAAKQFDIDLIKSYIIGDKISDIQAGVNAGCQSILIKTKKNGKDQEQSMLSACFQADSLMQAVEWIIAQ